MDAQIKALVTGRCPVPFDVLGMHPLGRSSEPGRVVRVFLTWAAAVDLVRDETVTPMQRAHEQGVFEVQIPDANDFFPYRLRVTDHEGHRFELDDPYRFLPVLDESSLAAFTDGHERRAHLVFGARVIEHHGHRGTCFAVWAPHAHNVNLMGEFNRWDARCHPMRPRGTTGVWELFVPGIGHGMHYKFEIRPPEPTRRLEKADPFGRAMELRPRTASLVWDTEPYPWGDADWMAARPARHAGDAAMAIYEIHPGSWQRHPDADPGAGRPGWLTYRELADRLLPYVSDLGFTHVELMPVAEHPLDRSWGYQTVGYFAPTSRYGTPDDFRYFVDQAHRHGIGVLLDWTPAHFPRDEHGLARFDGTPTFEHGDPRRGAHPDWGTLIFDYGRPAVVSFLVSNAIYWLEEFHVDGLRVDAVASMLYLDYSRKSGEWIPNPYGGRENLDAVSFLRKLNDAVHAECSGALMIAEESTAWPKVSHSTADGGLGFDLKWNMGWMSDTLEFMEADPLFRKGLYDKLTFSIWYAGSERFLLPMSHDEVVHLKKSLLRKMPGTAGQRLANLRLLIAYMWTHPGKKLLFMGGEFGQEGEWNHDGTLEWQRFEHAGHRGVHALVKTLNHLYEHEPALRALDLHPNGFEWIDCHDAARTTIAFIRWAPEWTDPVVVVANFTPKVWSGYRLPVPYGGEYQVLVNTGAAAYGTEPPHELPESLSSTEGAMHGRNHYVEFDLPPLAAVMMKPGGQVDR